MTRIPGKVDQQAAVDRAGIGSCGALAVGRATLFRATLFEKALACIRRQVVSFVGTVVIQKVALVADRVSVLNRRANCLPDHVRLW